jgi:ferredoxin
MCNKHCQGNCQPSEELKQSECLMCMNCLDDCKFDAIDFNTVSNKNVQIEPDISRRGILAAAFAGLMAMPAFRLMHTKADSRGLVRPPGALAEEEFVKRCIKCGQCMRLCPTNVIQPAGIEAGLTNIWTPIMNNRIGTSGCQHDCVACGYVCPTAAIRPLTLAEKLGKGNFSSNGPVKIGTAAFDRTRCLPWAHNTPCIVCQENCPVSPKAIYTREVFTPVAEGLKIKSAKDNEIVLTGNSLPADRFANGDYYCHFHAGEKEIREKIISNTRDMIKIASENSLSTVSAENADIQIVIRLQQPYVRAGLCIGCGICQHECPLDGQGAVIVNSNGQSREK